MATIQTNDVWRSVLVSCATMWSFPVSPEPLCLVNCAPIVSVFHFFSFWITRKSMDSLWIKKKFHKCLVDLSLLYQLKDFKHCVIPWPSSIGKHELPPRFAFFFFWVFYFHRDHIFSITAHNPGHRWPRNRRWSLTHHLSYSLSDEMTQLSR